VSYLDCDGDTDQTHVPKCAATKMCGRADDADHVLVSHSAVRLLLGIFASSVIAIGTLELSACGGKQGMNQPDGGAFDAARLDEPEFPEASCFVRIDSPPLQPGNHVPIGTDITTWDSNPPSSGDHYPIWAAFQEYDAAVPRGYYVHDLEHGAVDYLYHCPDAGDDGGACAAIVAKLEQAVAAMPDDPLCTDPGVRVRFVMTPDPLIDHPVAAAAWGWTYVADCVDLPTLEAFAKAHYAQAPENFCTNGTTGF